MVGRQREPAPAVSQERNHSPYREETAMILATVRFGGCRSLLVRCSTRGAEKRQQHESTGSQVFGHPAEDDSGEAGPK
jgi:hypothetical protein